MNHKKFTAYCGLYCKDCIPSRDDLFQKTKDLQKCLEVLRFNQYALLKAKDNPLFADYPKFYLLLQEVSKLQCAGPCREGGGKAVCHIRDCVKSKDLQGCWECPLPAECEHLKNLLQIHPHLLEHLNLIKVKGLESWAINRKKHYSWQ